MTRLLALALALLGSLVPVSRAYAEEDRSLGLQLLAALEAYRDVGVRLDPSVYEAPALDEDSARYLDVFTPPAQGHSLRSVLAAYRKEQGRDRSQAAWRPEWIYRKNRDVWARIFRAVKERIDASIRARYDARDDLFYWHYTARTYDELRAEAQAAEELLGALTKPDMAMRRRALSEQAEAIRASFAPLDRTFEGHWATAWNGGTTNMVLVVNGRSVTGTYDYRGGSITGTLSEDGRTLEGTWRQSENGFRGELRFRLSDDRESFRGTFGLGAATNSNYWNGKRAAR
ncbi:MAG: hypothetical protein R3F05_20265 [Planctomycetota bacterium]